jgi:predicted dehydrogenase
MIGVAIIGCGYWGPNLVRNFHALDDAHVVAVCDRDPERLEAIQRRFPAVRAERELAHVLEDPDVDAVAICTPVETHLPITEAALDARKHVMVEKPLAHSVAAAETMVERAEQLGLTLHVDHTFVYTGAIQKIRALMDAGEIGDLLYLDSVRINLGLFQSDVNVVWDLAPHDTSIIRYLVGDDPAWVSAIGSAHYGPLESQAYVTLKYEDTRIAHLHVNWLAPVKLRSTVIGGSRRMIVYDDLEPSEKVRIYDKGVTLSGSRAMRERALVDYRVGDMFAPHIDKTEPLELACQAFLDAIASGRPSPTDGRAGLAVVRVLEAADRSMRKDGERMAVGPPR